jgi:hypothetical protein
VRQCAGPRACTLEIETFRELFQSRGDLLCRADNRLAAQLLGSRHLGGRIRALGFLGRHERQTDALSAIDDRAFAGFELVQRFFFRVGRQRPVLTTTLQCRSTFPVS